MLQSFNNKKLTVAEDAVVVDAVEVDTVVVDAGPVGLDKLVL